MSAHKSRRRHWQQFLACRIGMNYCSKSNCRNILARALQTVIISYLEADTAQTQGESAHALTCPQHQAPVSQQAMHSVALQHVSRQQ